MTLSSPLRPPIVAFGHLRRFVQRHPLLCYFLLAYSLTWLVLSPYVLSQMGLLSLRIPVSTLVIVILAAYSGPFLAGFLMTAIVEGKPGLRHLLRRFMIWRVSWQWYLFVLLGYPLIRALGAAVLPGVLATYRLGSLQAEPLHFLSLFPLTFFVSALAEEPGWRGFALPRLQEHYGPLPGSLLLGLLWACWHIPLFLTSFEGHGGSGLLTILGFVIGTIGITIVITWAFNHTQESMLIALLGHAALDAFTASAVFSSPLALDQSAFLSVIVGFGGVTLLLTAATRGRLGYHRTHGPSIAMLPPDRNRP